jgi:hypothetical protein
MYHSNVAIGMQLELHVQAKDCVWVVCQIPHDMVHFCHKDQVIVFIHTHHYLLCFVAGGTDTSSE